MEYRRMGRSGLKVSALCLGTMTFGHGTDEAEAQRIVDMALDAGVNFFDTANSYGNGQSEALLGGSFRLEGAALERLNPVSVPPERYPQAMQRDMHERRDGAVKMPSW